MLRSPLTHRRCSRERFNHYLPRDIRIIRAAETDQGFNSRKDATSRVYQYRILNRPLPSALLRRHYHWERAPLKIEAMNRATLNLLGSHDFRPLAPGHPPDRSAVRKIFSWDVAPGRDLADTLVITCEGNGFMQHQIRRTNAVLVEIGKGRWPEDAFKAILGENEDQAEIIQPVSISSLPSLPSLPANGLYLMEVKYSESGYRVGQENETN